MKYFLIGIFIIAAEILPAQPVTLPVSVFLMDSVTCTEVKDQSQSPTCWVFGTNSLFESDLIRKYNLSEMFIARYAYIDKTNQFIATKGKSYFEGGGQFHDVIRVVTKYGMVPEEVYNGRPDGEYNHNHAKLDTAMKSFVHLQLREGKTVLSTTDLRHINDTLDKYLGKIPATFWYQEKSTPPKHLLRK